MVELNEIAPKLAVITRAQRTVDPLQQLTSRIISAVINVRITQSTAGISIEVRWLRMLSIDVVLVVLPQRNRTCGPLRYDCSLRAQVQAGKHTEVTSVLPHLGGKFTSKPDRAVIPDVAVELVPLSAYDELAAVHAPKTGPVRDGGVA